MAPPKPQVGIALSGGGHRASLMALGALLYAVDAGINKDVNTISSVSGGSITNAFVAQECDFRKVSPEGFEQLAHKLATAIVHRGVLDSTLISRYYLAVLAGMTVLTLWSFSRFSTNFFPWWTCVLSMIGLILLTTLRGALIEYLFGAVLFRKGARATTLGDIGGTTKHVLCATELVDAIPYYFVTGPEGYARGFVTRPNVQHMMFEETHSVPDVKLQAAVRASAGFPGAFPPRRLGLGPGAKRFLLLADGGLWNNLGTQWWDLDNSSDVLRSGNTYHRESEREKGGRSHCVRLPRGNGGVVCLWPTSCSGQ